MDQRVEGCASHGLIIGKFLPFHAGHKHLIEFALARCETVTVIVFSRSGEPVAGSLRADWIRQECPDAHVLHVPADYPDPWDEESWEYWTSLCRRCAPDATHLFTSESYGHELARRMRIAHIVVDEERKQIPVSGRQIRQDPLAHWQFIPNAVRPWLARKVAIVGAESTGKTTLAAQLAGRYGTVWVPEFGREYCERNAIHTLTPHYLYEIAAEQAKLEDEYATRSNGLLFCDTDLMVTRAWCHHLCGTVHPSIAHLERDRRYDLHLLTSLDVPWQNDGTRVCGGPGVREWFHARFEEELAQRGRPMQRLPPRQGDAFALACNVVETLWPQSGDLDTAHREN